MAEFDRGEKQERFWNQLFQSSERQHSFDLFSDITPQQQGWVNKTTGIPYTKYKYYIRNHKGGVAIYIQGTTKERHERIFDQIKRHQTELESSFGSQFVWNRYADKRACRINKQVTNHGLIDEHRWDTIHDQLIDAMKRLANAFSKTIDKDKIQ